MHEEITLTREVSAIQIPSGDSLILPVGTPVFITQRLGGTFTVATSQGLARISAQDSDALGVNMEEEKKKHAESVRLKDAPLEEQVWAQLKGVYDPEIPVDIVNLGLVYDCIIEEAEGKKTVQIKMTLTAPGCGMGPVLAGDVKHKVEALPGIHNAEVEVVFDPVWDRSMMSEAARLQLGMMW
jgi:probable FeS assembly SUF system protein SufT